MAKSTRREGGELHSGTGRRAVHSCEASVGRLLAWPDTESVMTQTRKTYTGPFQGAEDMLTIEIGEKIEVRHFSR